MKTLRKNEKEVLWGKSILIETKNACEGLMVGYGKKINELEDM